MRTPAEISQEAEWQAREAVAIREEAWRLDELDPVSQLEGFKRLKERADAYFDRVADLMDDVLGTDEERAAIFEDVTASAERMRRDILSRNEAPLPMKTARELADEVMDSVRAEDDPLSRDELALVIEKRDAESRAVHAATYATLEAALKRIRDDATDSVATEDSEIHLCTLCGAAGEEGKGLETLHHSDDCPATIAAAALATIRADV